MRVRYGPEKPFDLLSGGKNYLKSVYKSHLGPEEPCADHCTVFALSDPVEEKFSSEFCHDHNQECPECKGIADVLNDNDNNDNNNDNNNNNNNNNNDNDNGYGNDNDNDNDNDNNFI